MGKTVTVTGASGYVAGHIIRELIVVGHTVRGTVRDLQSSNADTLRELFPEVQLFQADLLTPDSFDQAFEGSDFVIHTASPFVMAVADPKTELIEPAVKGTLNVLKSAKKARVQRVVITSSIAAIQGTSNDPEKVWTEEDWNLDATLRTAPYQLSKRLAEQAAWNFIKTQGKYKGSRMDLVVINPGFVIGPPVSRRSDATSIKIVKSFLDGTAKANGGCFPFAFPCVDVRDVAAAHVSAIETGHAAGNRYLLASTVAYSHLDLANILRRSGKFDGFSIPDTEMAPVKYRGKYNNYKAEHHLNLNYTPIEISIIDMASSLIQLGIVSAPSARL